MRILYLVSGRDALWGGATIRDAAFVRGLRLLGHEVEALSIAGHALVDGTPEDSELFSNMASGRFKTMFPRLVKVPTTIAGLIKKPRPVRNMTSFAVAGYVDKDGPLAVAVLSGRDKKLRREYVRTLEYIKTRNLSFDIVVLSNAMLSGMAEPLGSTLNCPVVCLTQGSDRYVEELAEPYRSDARKLVRKNARNFAKAIATSRFFAIRATEFLALPPSRVTVVTPGIDVERFTGTNPRIRKPFIVGFLSPIHHRTGLDIIVDAVDSLNKANKTNIQLWIGGQVADDRYWQRVRRRLESTSLKDDYRVFGPLDTRARRDFYQEISTLAIAPREPESKGIIPLEAMSMGIPVVAPSTGIVPELFHLVKGGLLVSPELPVWMYAKSFELLSSIPETADKMGETAAEGVRAYFTMEAAAARLAEELETTIQTIH